MLVTIEDMMIDVMNQDVMKSDGKSHVMIEEVTIEEVRKEEMIEKTEGISFHFVSNFLVMIARDLLTVLRRRTEMPNAKGRPKQRLLVALCLMKSRKSTSMVTISLTNKIAPPKEMPTSLLSFIKRSLLLKNTHITTMYTLVSVLRK